MPFNYLLTNLLVDVPQAVGATIKKGPPAAMAEINVLVKGHK